MQDGNIAANRTPLALTNSRRALAASHRSRGAGASPNAITPSCATNMSPRTQGTFRPTNYDGSPRSIVTRTSLASRWGSHNEPQRDVLSRRNIYYKRLVGDVFDTSSSKAKARAARNANWQVVARFLLYALIANAVIVYRADITTLHSVNSSVRATLESGRFDANSPVPHRFKDIKDPGDVFMWLKSALMPLVDEESSLSNIFSLSSYNRIIPQAGVCSDSASIKLTVRRAATTLDYDQTTTARFASLYKEAWLVDTVPPGSSFTEGELTRSVQGNYQYSGGLPPEIVPEKRVGEVIAVRWAYTPPSFEGAVGSGFRGEGGYVALWTLGRAGGTVHLQDPGADLFASPSNLTRQLGHLGVCYKERVSNVLTARDFFDIDFLGRRFASIAVEFTLYNANYQTLSKVVITFTANAVGIISDKDIDVDTIRLDVFAKDGFSALIPYLEAVYLIWTVFYFFHFVYQVWKDYNMSIRDIWCYITFMSIISSLMSLACWYMFYSPKMKEFLRDGQQYTGSLRDEYESFLLYKRAAAFAVLTIWLRFLNVLSSSRARVRMMLNTIAMSAGNMAIYMAYIMVILLGFWSLALTSFSAYSAEFVTPAQSFISCFSLFLGKIDVMDGLPTMFVKGPFKILFLLFFFFICVQMFNAIINYSYNRVSEDMEHQFEVERAERKRRRLYRRLAREDASRNKISRCVKKLVSLFSDEAEEDEERGTAHSDKSDTDRKLDAPAFENIADDHLKAKVEAFIGQEKRRKAPEALCSRALYFLFGLSYIAFLYLNIPVSTNAKIQHAFRSAVEQKGVVSEDGSTMKLKDVRTVADVANWMTNGLPQVIFESTPPDVRASALEAGVADDAAICINTWNCIIASKAKDSSRAKLVRVTQRLAKKLPNSGTVSINATREEAFVAGSKFIEWRRADAVISPESSASTDIEDFDRVFDESDGEGVFCKRVEPGQGGFMSLGGIECFLDADPAKFAQQLRVMSSRGFYSLYTATLAVDFVAFNANAETLIYSSITFTVDPSGTVTTRTHHDTMVLMDLANMRANHVAIFKRCIPGLIYFVLVLYFLIELMRDLVSEWYRRYINENASKVTTTIQFFTLDLFNLLDALSIAISIVSLVLYIAWIHEETRLASQSDLRFASMLENCGGLATMATAYNRLSALNMLIIFVRPLKFARDNPRMAKLNQTLFDARVDIFWFVVVFAISMFAYVMFAYLSFGSHVTQLSSIDKSLNYCFYYILGTFQYDAIYSADPFMAVLFFFSYLLLFYCVFTNIFFAIIDRFFVSADAPPFNLKRTLKPFLSRVCRCIEWDEDYVMEGADKDAKSALGPQSRRDRVKATHRQIEVILQSAGENVLSAGSKRSKQLIDVCELDERLSGVMRWSRDEARKFVEDFQRFSFKKQDPKRTKNEALFVKGEIMAEVHEQLKGEHTKMEDAERQARYAIQVHERMVARDQHTLARYILTLEGKIHKHMKKRTALLTELHHLRGETEAMRFTREEVRQGILRCTAKMPEAAADPSQGHQSRAHTVLVVASDGDSMESEGSQQGGSGAASDGSRNPGGLPKTGDAASSQLPVLLAAPRARGLPATKGNRADNRSDELHQQQQVAARTAAASMLKQLAVHHS